MENNQECPACKGETIPSIWTEDIIVLHCEPCKRRFYYSKKLHRLLEDSEINKLNKDWQ